MIKTLTPHYVTTPFVSPLTSTTCTEYTLQLYVWDGDKSSVPAEPTYEVTIENVTSSTGDSKINISRLVNDYIDFTPQSGDFTKVIDGNNQMWLQHNVIYTTTNASDDDVKQNITTDLMVSGYGYGLDGENPSTPTNKVLKSGTEFNIYDEGFSIIPILIDENTAGQTISAISYPNNELNSTIALPDTEDSSELVQYLWLEGADFSTDEYVEIIYNGVTITLYVTDECKYTPVEIFFQNKEGALQSIDFFKARKDSISVKNETFESDRGQPNTGAHQFVKYNVNSKSEFSVNSGFVDEDSNEEFKQLLLSEKVWIYFSGTFIPLNVKKTSLEYKTRKNDKLINYEIDFEYAFNDINSI